jgi:hypothetical protein
MPRTGIQTRWLACASERQIVLIDAGARDFYTNGKRRPGDWPLSTPPSRTTTNDQLCASSSLFSREILAFQDVRKRIPH